jgi:thiol-disulfide isomerase/thioredoxin
MIKKNIKEHKKLYVGGLTIILILSLLAIMHLIHRQNNYVSLPQSNTPAKILSTSQDYANSNKLSYEIYYRPDCIDCQKMMKAGLVKALHQTKGNVVAINTLKFKNANKKQSSAWFSENYVTNTPTLIVKSHGYPIYLYAGDNIKTFKTLLNGKNPKTNKTLSHSKHPTKQYYQNDFTKSDTTFVPYKVNQN